MKSSELKDQRRSREELAPSGEVAPDPLANGQPFEDSILYLREAVMVFVQNAARVRDCKTLEDAKILAVGVRCAAAPNRFLSVSYTSIVPSPSPPMTCTFLSGRTRSVARTRLMRIGATVGENV